MDNLSDTCQIQQIKIIREEFTAWKVSKYEVISGPYFPVFGLNTEKYGPEKTLHLDTFHAVCYYAGIRNELSDLKKDFE